MCRISTYPATDPRTGWNVTSVSAIVHTGQQDSERFMYDAGRGLAMDPPLGYPIPPERNHRKFFRSSIGDFESDGLQSQRWIRTKSERSAFCFASNKGWGDLILTEVPILIACRPTNYDRDSWALLISNKPLDAPCEKLRSWLGNEEGPVPPIFRIILVLLRRDDARTARPKAK